MSEGIAACRAHSLFEPPAICDVCTAYLCRYSPEVVGEDASIADQYVQGDLSLEEVRGKAADTAE